MNILIVDDRDDNRYLLEVLLRGNGHAVLSAANGAEAIERLKSDGVELIISDILMPVMDGFELCRRIKIDEGLRHIPFIVYTATYTGPQDEAFAIQIGADRFIQKPCEPDVFLEAVHDVMASAKNHDFSETPQPREEEIFKLYNERLVRKLEQKMLQLEKETKALRETEVSLRVSENKYRRLHESMIDGFVYVDMQGNIRETNESYRRMLGYTNEAFSSLTHRDLTPEKWHAFEQDIVIHQILSNGFSEVYEKEYRKKDGTVFPVEMRMFLIRNDRGEKEGMWAIVRDLTERKRAEAERERLMAQFQQAQKMESVGRLAGGVAHDYNNMLGVILGFTELALEKTPPSEPLYDDLQEILKAAIRSMAVTRQLLAFARQQTIAPKVLNLNETVAGMLKMLRHLIGEDVDLAWRPEPALWPVRMDPSQLDQILANLCVNARDAIADIGKITIETDKVIFDEAYCADHAGFIPGEFVRLAVSDNGCGIDQKMMASIFEPFFTTKELGKGTGLGLATVYGIVKQNQGFINVYSEPGQGTTFRIYLPRHQNKTEPRASESLIGPVMGGQETILLVEDEPAILKMTTIMLESLGYTVLATATPVEAIRLVEARDVEIHLLMTDVVMPQMNGRDLAKTLWSLCPNIKRLFMSGYTADVIAHHGMLEPGIHFIQKPFSIMDLAAKVREAIENNDG